MPCSPSAHKQQKKRLLTKIKNCPTGGSSKVPLCWECIREEGQRKADYSCSRQQTLKASATGPHSRCTPCAGFHPAARARKCASAPAAERAPARSRSTRLRSQGTGNKSGTACPHTPAAEF